jgi:aspartate aminotransferase-like enzyme
MAARPPAWLWCVHCETSTGLLNDLAVLKALCALNGTKLCLDCISSIGTLPVDLKDVWLASCASGKGLRSFPGLGMVFYNHELAGVPARIPRYLDLGHYARCHGVAFTQSSNLVHALKAAVKPVDWARRFAELAETSAWLRTRLAGLGFKLVGAGADVSPAVITIALPMERESAQVGAELGEAGFLVSCNSEYLREHTWIQVCLMGESSREKLGALLNHLNRICFRRGRSAAVADKAGPVTG